MHRSFSLIILPGTAAIQFLQQVRLLNRYGISIKKNKYYLNGHLSRLEICLK